MHAATAYRNLTETFAEIIKLDQIKALLLHDQEIFMPAGSSAARAGHIDTIDKEIHRKITDPRVKDWLGEARSGSKKFRPSQSRNLDIMNHIWKHMASIPSRLAREMTRIETEGGLFHLQHHKSGDWKQGSKIYAQAFKVAREVDAVKQDTLGLRPYEASMDGYSPDLALHTVEKIFHYIAEHLPPLIREIREKQAQEGEPLPLQGIFPAGKQMELNRKVAAAMGFDFGRGRLDATDGHPACYGAPDDVRCTTRIIETDPFFSLSKAIHEASGHGVYEQNLPGKWRNQPIGTARDLGIHESQSRFMEAVVAATPECIAWLSGLFIETFGYQPALEPDNLCRLIQRVKPGPIRIAADEATYPLHVILRWELEQAAIEGRLNVASDLPGAFNDGMEKYLGIRPRNHAEGCMQDCHWTTGSVGYFPTYLTGTIMAVQFFREAVRQYPEIYACMARGDFSQVNGWRRENVHQHGSLLPIQDLVLKATGDTLSGRHLLNHDSERYLGEVRDYPPEKRRISHAPR